MVLRLMGGGRSLRVSYALTVTDRVAHIEAFLDGEGRDLPQGLVLAGVHACAATP